MEEELDKQKIKADTDHFMVTGKGNIIESSLRGHGLWHWGYQLGSMPLGCHRAPSERAATAQGKSPGVAWVDCNSVSQEMGREQTRGNVKAN